MFFRSIASRLSLRSCIIKLNNLLLQGLGNYYCINLAAYFCNLMPQGRHLFIFV